MPSDDFDESADPLTAPLWPVSEAAEVLKFDPSGEERPQSDAPRASVPKPPDVDQILRGEYTGWVPVIKAGESLVDAQERAAAKIRRIEAEIDAADLDGAHSVSMWIPYNSGAVPLPPKVTNVPPAPKAPPTMVIPTKATEPEPVGEFTRFIPDPDQVLSASDALDEARKRIRQMREDLESNVQMVTRSFEHEFFVVGGDDDPGQQVEAESVDVIVVATDGDIEAFESDEGLDADTAVTNDVAALVTEWAPPTVTRPTKRTLEDIADEIEAAIDANDARIGEHVINAEHLRERLRQQRSEVADAVAAIAASATLSPGILHTLNITTEVESVNGVPVLGQDLNDDPSLEPLNADRPARVASADGATFDDEPVAAEVLDDLDDETYNDNDEDKVDIETVVVIDDYDESDTDDFTAVQPGDLASDIDEEIEDAVIVSAPTPTSTIFTTPPVTAGSVGGDSEAKFLGDLLDSLSEVEAAVTAVVNTTALDDVLAKYRDILDAETNSVTEEDLQTAAQVEAMVAETRIDINAMIRGLKAAAETFSDEDAGQGVASAAATLEGILTTPAAALREDRNGDQVAAAQQIDDDAVAEPVAQAPEAVPAAQAHPAPEPAIVSVAEEVARMRAAALAALHLKDIDTPAAAPDSVVIPEPVGVSVADDDSAVLVDTNSDVAQGDVEQAIDHISEPAPQPVVVEVPAQPEVAQPVAPPPAADPNLASLVDSALRPITLPPIFRGEPKRMTAQDQLDALGGSVPDMRPPRPRPASRPMPPRRGSAAAQPEPPAAPPVAAQPPAEPIPAPAVAPQALTPPVAPPPIAQEPRVPGSRRADIVEEFEIDKIIEAAAAREIPAPAALDGEPELTAAEVMGLTPRSRPAAPAAEVVDTVAEEALDELVEVIVEAVDSSELEPEPGPERVAAGTAEPVAAQAASDETASDAVSRRIADESIFQAAANSPTAATYVLNEHASKDHSLELVIMRDEIRDLRDRLDSSQRLIEDLMVRLAQLTEIALKNRLN